MSNGSPRSSGALRPRQAQSPSRRLSLLFAAGFVTVGGCHHATLHERSDLQAELSAVTAEDFLLLAVSHARSGDLLRAEQYLSAARQRGHDEEAVVYWLVRVCVAASRYQSALIHAADYLRDHPSDWPLRFVVASIHEALGDLDRAQSELERIVRAEPSIPLAHYRLAMLYRDREGEGARAMLHLEQYLVLNPEGPHAAEVRSAMSEIVDVSNGPRLIAHPGAGKVGEGMVP